METPPRRREYTQDEKKQLLANLEIEVQDRIRQFEAHLAHSLEAFKLRHENEVTRIPRVIRVLTMAEFADKYDGDVNKALQAITRARMEAGADLAGLDASARKRKWQPSVDESQEVDLFRAIKNARVGSPHKKEAAGARPRLAKTPGARLRRVPRSPGPASAKPSPHKSGADGSPTKFHQHMPSTSSFNPALPKTPAFPRRPRANESLLSINGSPLANPYDLAYPSGNRMGSPIRLGENASGRLGDGHRKLERQRSIAILRGPSISQKTGTQGSQPSSALEVVLSIKVPTADGTMLELDPLATSSEDLDILKGVSDEARQRAKDELLELGGLMARLGKWRI